MSIIKKLVACDYGVLIEEEGVALRGLFIIDPEGEVKYQVVNDNNVGRSVDETLRVLQALQSGGLCPINWKPGDKHLVANESKCEQPGVQLPAARENSHSL